ncbi:carbohydrate esterase family 3 protein [Teratosphaeria nubilosa]|uniref:Carbohydrate esterase family 3 protein n=1 Tax=Teratosphaeria nubilosa TaxID=161662 RepID=A0A6G1KUU4_9PEZI|nr:carbohydrate esterase family 3 protein [Teratosphaeria nubilosa]
MRYITARDSAILACGLFQSQKADHEAGRSSIWSPMNSANSSGYPAVDQLATLMPPMQSTIASLQTSQLDSFIHVGTGTQDQNSTPADAPHPLRVMIVGDSMSQGAEGDWTWRYRIWQWFEHNEIEVRFVGPYTGTVSPDPPSPPTPPPLYNSTGVIEGIDHAGGYAKGVDPAFLSNCNHFSVWGQAVAVDKFLIKDVLQSHPADLILFMLGFNDMGWLYSDASGTLESVATFVVEARAANPDLQFAIANAPRRSYISGREDLIRNTHKYNSLLPLFLSKWTTKQSPIHLVDLESNYACEPAGCPAGYDGLHPNAWGEFQIAHAFSLTLLHSFGLGHLPLAVPDQNDRSLARNLTVPSDFLVRSSPQGITATWDPVYGAYAYDIRITINDGDWSIISSSTNRWDPTWPFAGASYSLAVRATAGDRKGEWTAVQSAIATPELAPPPSNIDVQALSDGFCVTWDPPTGPYTDSIVEYNVLFWNQDPEACEFLGGAAFKESPAVLTNLKPGANYLVGLLTWNKNGQGFPTIAQNVRPGANKPDTPSNVTVHAKDTTSAHITWNGSAAAAGYKIWARNMDQHDSALEIIATLTDSTCSDQGMPFPGVTNYQFAVSAFNGNSESGRSATVLASPPEAGHEHLTCPMPMPWCPDRESECDHSSAGSSGALLRQTKEGLPGLGSEQIVFSE